MRALRALAHQVTELLELRRLIVTAQLDVKPALTIDLAYLTDDYVQGLRCIADARNICITLIVEHGAPLRADPRQLSRVLGYIVFTALKVAPADGQVGVRVRDTPVPSIEFAHAGGAMTADWYAELTGMRHSDDPVPRAVAEILRAHGATVTCTPATVGSPGVLIELRFPAVERPAVRIHAEAPL